MALLLAGGAGSVHACRAPPMRLTAQAQIAAARDVSLARVVGATPVYDDERPAPGSAAALEAALSPPWVDAQGLWQSRPLLAPRPQRLTPSAVVYEFAVQERFAGADEPTFTIRGAVPPERYVAPPPEADYNEDAFWGAGGGRLSSQNTCFPDVSFMVGELYLVFLGLPAKTRAFERVLTIDGQPNPGDKWLAYVRAAWPDRAPRAQP